MLSAAPYMNHALPIMIPIYQWYALNSPLVTRSRIKSFASRWELPYFWAGAKAYDLVAGSRRVVPASHFLSKGMHSVHVFGALNIFDADEAVFHFPMLREDHLKGAIVYYDGQMNDTRMSLTIALTASQLGAVCVNRIKCLGLLKNDQGNLCGARVKDTLTQEEWNIYAKAIVNATGCFADTIRKWDDPDAHEIIVPVSQVLKQPVIQC
jgi:glycerol-3-phosphate dehydrogenase